MFLSVDIERLEVRAAIDILVRPHPRMLFADY
jgi:hypothetical protein